MEVDVEYMYVTKADGTARERTQKWDGECYVLKIYKSFVSKLK